MHKKVSEKLVQQLGLQSRVKYTCTERGPPDLSLLANFSQNLVTHYYAYIMYAVHIHNIKTRF